jgi:hypothetical protein
MPKREQVIENEARIALAARAETGDCGAKALPGQNSTRRCGAKGGKIL